MQTGVFIREYDEKDKPAVLELLKLNTPRYFSPKEEADLVHYLAHEIDHYFVVEYDGKVVGCGGINFADERSTGKISWDILHPDYQGKGIGSTLLHYRVRKMKEMEHIKTIIVRTSQMVYKFYEKNGFELKEVVRDYWAEGFDLYQMEYTKT